jgi:transmembrane protein EpsG
MAPDKIRPNKVLVFGAMASLVATAGLRSNIGDTFNYKNIYVDNDFTWEYILSQKDYGFGILQMVLKNYISEDPQIMIFTAALITNVLIVIVFYNYSRMIELSLYVYITGGLFLVSMNGIRQVLAAAIAFTAINYLIKGNWIKYSLIILFASSFHQSALILIPFYFLVRYRAWSKSTVIVIVLAVLAVVGFDQFSALLFTALDDTQYSGYENFDEGGSNILRTLVAGGPLFIAYLGRKRLKNIFPHSDYIVNMALFGVVFMLISTQWWIFARVSIYFELYNLILISWIAKLFSERDGRILYYGMLVCYLFYFYYEHVISLNIIYRSNFLTW